MKRNIIALFFSAMLFLTPLNDADAQKASLSTDLVGYLDFVTMNLEASYPIARKWSINAGVRYNPFTFNLGNGREDARNKQKSYAAGVRFWPWHVFSGWWLAGKLQYQEYNRGGILSQKTTEGDRFGAGLSGGYAYMIGKHFNVEFGLGFWGGFDKFTTYSCPVCGLTEAAGQRFFVLPSEVLVALSYVF